MKRRTKAIEETTTEVIAGKHETAEDALRALNTRLHPEPSAAAR